MLASYVLDTDVAVAALRSDRGASRQLLLAALNRQFELLLSVPLILEYEAVMTRPQHLAACGLSSAEVGHVLDDLAAVARPVRLAFRWRPRLSEPDDDMVLETAINGSASAFELHISWVLGMCGLSAVVLGEYEKLLAEQTSVERASVDILASGQNQKSLIVAACTIGTPKEEDFTNLVHACEILRREVFSDTSVAVYPIVFTGALGVASYKEVADGFGGIPIVDADRLEIVLELFELGLERFFLDFVGNPQLCELRSPTEELR